MTLEPRNSNAFYPVLDTLCPMHVVLDASGLIIYGGPTVCKLFDGKSPVGTRFLDRFEIQRPRTISTISALRQSTGRKLQLRVREGDRTPVKAVIAPLPDNRSVVHFSFGIHVVDAVVDYSLTSTDFAATDLAMELLYLVEAKSAAMDASRRLNARLQGAAIAAEEQAYTDTLTGLRNRRAMDSALKRYAATGDPFALLHVDLDFFKQVNDTFGHAAGDDVLQKAAHIMENMIRKEDLVARIGGDEFVIVVSGLVKANRLRQMAETLIEQLEIPILFGNVTCKISASIGITCSKGDNKSPEELLEEADIALYVSKRSGRSQYTQYQPGMAQAAG